MTCRQTSIRFGVMLGVMALLGSTFAQDDQACAAYGMLEPHPPPNTLTEQERAEGWQLLFDGRSMEAWRGFKQDEMPAGGWKAVGGCLVRAAEGGDIITREQFDDFELVLEWRVPAGEPGNSGIFFNVTEEGGAVYETGPEMQILNNAVHPDGGDPKTSAGANYGLHAPTTDALLPPGMFNTARIRVEGDHVEQWLNGAKVVEYTLGSPEWQELVAASKFAEWPYGQADAGHIALQDHGDLVWFRNIKVRPLNVSAQGGQAGARAAGTQNAQAQNAQAQPQAQNAQVQPDPRIGEGELPIAIQMYSLRDYGSQEGGVFEEQLQLAADAGYSWIETVGDHGLAAEEMNALLDEYGLEVASTHVGLDVLQNDLESVIAFNEAVGNTNVVMPYATAEGAEGWQELGRTLNEVGARLREAGMTLAYHNHDFEMEEIDGKLALDWLLEAAEPRNLKVQLDVAWVARGGQDPVELLNRYAGRVVSIHAKDNAPEGENEDQGGWADVGYGVLDWAQILSAADQAGVNWYIVEHDEPRDHLTTAGRSYEFLADTLPGILEGENATAGSPEERIATSLQTVMQLAQEAMQASRAAAQAQSVEEVKGHVAEVYAALWGVEAGMVQTGAADVQVPGWAERWRVDAPEHGLIGHGLYARKQMRALAARATTGEGARRFARRADASLSNVIGWMWLDDGVLYGEKTARPRVDLTYVWDYPVEFWNTTADTGWMHEVHAQALNILKTDYEGDAAMAREHAGALVPLLERAMSGTDENGNGTVEPAPMEGGLQAVMAQARQAGWTAERAAR